MNNAHLLIGGNLGNRNKNLSLAMHLLGHKCGNIVKQSAVYETAPWGKTDQQNFYNQALLLQTVQEPLTLLENILSIELKMGRERAEKNGPRIIDIDILFYNDEIIDVPNLRVPHPEMQNRRFVLVPLNEIAAEFIHPVLKKDIQTLLRECTDNLEVIEVI